jgi:hypothetical protein
MSLLLELFLHKNADLSDYKFEIPYYEWEGIKYLQGAAESRFFENCILQKSEESFIRTYFPESYQDEQLQEINIKAESLRSMFYLGSSDIEIHLSNIKQILITLTEKQDK